MAFFVKSVCIFPNILLPDPAGSQPLLLPVASPCSAARDPSDPPGSSSISAFLGGWQSLQCCAELPAATPTSIGILLAKFLPWEELLSCSVVSGAWWPRCSRCKTRGVPGRKHSRGGFTLPAAQISKCGKPDWCPELPPGSQSFGLLLLMTRKIPWGGNPGLLKQNHSLSLER